LFVFVLVFHSTKSWRGGYFFLLFVKKMTIQQDDDVLPSGFLSANAASAESGDQPEVGK
jgi:hypothetical protein